MSKVRIGVVGIGHLGNYHLQKYHKSPHTEIVAVADIVEERARKAAVDYACDAYTDHRKLIGTVDAVSITVPTGCHYRIAKDFLEAGADVLLEKPIAATLAEADELVTIAERKNLIFQIGFVERFNPAVVALKTVIGEPLFIEAHRLHPFFERGTDVDVILDLMIHDLDIILNFVKSPVKNVDAVGVPVLSDKVDIANVRLVFSSGCVANITASRISNKVMQKIRFFGREGYHAVDYGKRELISLGRKNSEGGQVKIAPNQVEVKPQDPLEEEIRSFLKAVTDRTPPPVSGREGMVSLDLAIRILNKIRTAGEPVL
ncbi:MAG: Gfo/Idh/MocA family oxidoreductase [Syntrophales bacterium]|nr:Gfo/Idh/MocA family oxidoreductase [Syntrophales bacterium]